MANEFYALATSIATIEALTSTNLSSEPHPCEFHEEFETAGTGGDGSPIAVGSPWAVWTWGGPLSAEEWDNLFTLSGIGTAASATVFIRTRTNEISSGTYQYRNYQAIMYRPTGESRPPYRFDDVEIKFTKLVVQT